VSQQDGNHIVLAGVRNCITGSVSGRVAHFRDPAVNEFLFGFAQRILSLRRHCTAFDSLEEQTFVRLSGNNCRARLASCKHTLWRREFQIRLPSLAFMTAQASISKNRGNVFFEGNRRLLLSGIECVICNKDHSSRTCLCHAYQKNPESQLRHGVLKTHWHMDSLSGMAIEDS
jgi:hypothetical protein